MYYTYIMTILVMSLVFRCTEGTVAVTVSSVMAKLALFGWGKQPLGTADMYRFKRTGSVMRGKCIGLIEMYSTCR
jgi:hypothetical protein